MILFWTQIQRTMTIKTSSIWRRKEKPPKPSKITIKWALEEGYQATKEVGSVLMNSKTSHLSSWQGWQGWQEASRKLRNWSFRKTGLTLQLPQMWIRNESRPADPLSQIRDRKPWTKPWLRTSTTGQLILLLAALTLPLRCGGRNQPMKPWCRDSLTITLCFWAAPNLMRLRSWKLLWTWTLWATMEEFREVQLHPTTMEVWGTTRATVEA
jgi:hypothetical protein